METQIKQNRKQNWFQKQFSGGKSQDHHPKEGAYETAVAAAAFAIQSVEEAKANKVKSKSRKDNGRNGMLHSNGICSQFSYKKTKSAENSMKKPKDQKTKAAKSDAQSATITIAPGDNAEWYDRLTSVIACGGDKKLKTDY